MNAPDVNLLVYAYYQSSPFHLKARQYLEASLTSTELFGLPMLCIHGFIRIASGNSFGTSKLPLEDALSIVDEWLLQPNVRILHPGPRHWNILKDLAIRANASGRLFSDAAIAAIAIEHNAVVHTNDRDFARFPGLLWLNPLET